MIIRDQQIKALENASVDSFIDELCSNCNEFAPGPTKVMFDDELEAAVKKGIERADEHGFDLRGPVRVFIDLMISFGSGFDTDPQYQWASEILAKKDELAQMERADALNEKMQSCFENIFGDENKHSLKALEAMLARVRQGLTFKREGFNQDMLDLLKEVHPQKYDEVGEAALKKLISEGIACGRDRYGFKAPRSMALVIVLMFAFGHKFDADPFLPWISRTLKENK